MSVLKELKKEGLNISEDAVAKVVKAVFRAIPKALVEKNSPVAAIVAGILPIIEPHALELVDKIDGENDYGPGSDVEAE